MLTGPGILLWKGEIIHWMRERAVARKIGGQSRLVRWELQSFLILCFFLIEEKEKKMKIPPTEEPLATTKMKLMPMAQDTCIISVVVMV